MPDGGFAYVSIIDWPSSFTRQDMVRAVSTATGMDPYLAAQRVAKPVPMVLMRMPPPAAASALESLGKSGVTAFAPTDEQLASVPAPIRAKSLSAAEGAPEPMYFCEVWRGEPFGLRPRDIFLLVRARIAKTEFAGTRTEVDIGYSAIGGGPVSMQHEVPVERTTVADMIDLYLRQDRGPITRVRIDGRKFNFDVLGKARALSDNTNADSLSLLIARQAPHAVIDTRFGDFSCPPGTVKVTAARFSPDSRQRRDDHPVFEFYSAWSCLMCLGLMGG